MNFIEEFKQVFDHPDYRANAFLRLMSLSQGHRSVSDYTIEFWTLAAEVDWTEDVLWAAYTRGLSERRKDKLVSRDEPVDVDSLISLRNRLYSCLQTQRCEATAPSTRSRLSSL